MNDKYHCGVMHQPCQSLLARSFVDHSQIKDFIAGEQLGTEVNPRCGSCKCSKCPIVGHSYSFQEEQELSMIRTNLRYDQEKKLWTTKYPWVIDPSVLPDNYPSAYSTLKSTERKLRKDLSWAETYHSQINDMVNRQVAEKLTTEELHTWDGPVFYLSHLAVPNPKSQSTPVRIVFNSSQVYKGHSLNKALAKGLDSYLNNLLGVLLRSLEGRGGVSSSRYQKNV